MIIRKQGFWLLVIVFSLIAMFTVLNGENRGEKIVKEMDGTMGFMMKRDHAAGKTLGDLFNTALPSKPQSMGMQHSATPFLKAVDLTGSAAILLLFPLIAGASVLMIILWV